VVRHSHGKRLIVTVNSYVIGVERNMTMSASKDCTKLNVIAYLITQEYPKEEAEEVAEKYIISIDEGLEDGLSAEHVGDALIKLDQEDFDNQCGGEYNG
jgi:hypothetical protein